MRKLPPRSVMLPLGPVKVVWVEEMDSKGRELLGRANSLSRTIELHTALKQADPATMWSVFWHEVAHFALFDSGAHNVLSERQAEAVCDAMGVALAVQYRQAGKR